MGTGTVGTTWETGTRTVDVVILTAIRLEFDAVLKVDDGAVPGSSVGARDRAERIAGGVPPVRRPGRAAVASRRGGGPGDGRDRGGQYAAPAGGGAQAAVHRDVRGLRGAARQDPARRRDRGGPALLPRHRQATAGRSAAGSDDVQPARRLEGCARGAGCRGALPRGGVVPGPAAHDRVARAPRAGGAARWGGPSRGTRSTRRSACRNGSRSWRRCASGSCSQTRGAS